MKSFKFVLLTCVVVLLMPFSIKTSAQQSTQNKPKETIVAYEVAGMNDVVLSAAKVTTITFKNGAQITMPYAWTLLIVKKDGKWKIAHAHN